jgi:hypothetical protein
VKQFSGIGEALSNTPTKNKPRLVATNQRWDEGLKAISQNFGDALDSAVLKRNGPEILGFSSLIFFREEHKVGAV